MFCSLWMFGLVSKSSSLRILTVFVYTNISRSKLKYFELKTNTPHIGMLVEMTWRRDIFFLFLDLFRFVSVWMSLCACACVKWSEVHWSKRIQTFASQYDRRTMTRTRFHLFPIVFYSVASMYVSHSRHSFFSLSSYWSLNLELKPSEMMMMMKERHTQEFLF